jgi:hypothetical protein
MDKVDNICYPRVFYTVDVFPSYLCLCRTKIRILRRISGDLTSFVWQFVILYYHRRYPSDVSRSGFCLEIVYPPGYLLIAVADECITQKNTITSKKSRNSTSRIIDHGNPVRNPTDNRMEQFQKAIRKVRQVQRMRKQRGYAFSQGDEGQMRLIRAYDTTQLRGKYGEMKAAPQTGVQRQGPGGYI